MRRCVILVVAIALGLGVFPAVCVADEDIAGNYNVSGSDPNGAYTGTAHIEQAAGDAYRFKEEIGGKSYHGIGIREGDALSVSIRETGDDTYTVIAVYHLRKNGKLVGHWTQIGFKGKIFDEALTPQ